MIITWVIIWQLYVKNQLSEVYVIKTKTIKTLLMTAEAYGPTSCTSGLASESRLSRRPEVQYCFVPKLSHHGRKTPKTVIRYYMLDTTKTVFSVFPLMMSLVAKQQVMMSGLA